jgi:Cyclic nucleotide-binding domain/4Fe-4S binding domain
MAVAALPLFIVLVGYHRWRRICPLAFFAQLPGLARRPGTRKASAWLEKNYHAVALSFFVFSLWMRLIATNGDGNAIAVFFIAISLGALVVGAIYTGKTWCNHFCPVSFIEKIYTEPQGLRPTENSQCEKCSACKKFCPDINEENGYWKEILSRPKRAAYFAFPGLVFGFYFYYYLQAGNWDYYFGGSWTKQPGLLTSAFFPGHDATSAGFFFLQTVPRAVAALLTLVVCGVLSFLIFSLLERPIGSWLRRRDPEADAARVRHVVFSICAFTAFVTFYSFAGQPSLRKVTFIPASHLVLITVVLTASMFLVARLRRTQKQFAEETLARSIIRRWEWVDVRPPRDLHEAFLIHTIRSRETARASAQVLEIYKDSVREALSDGFVTREQVYLLESLRNQLQIKKSDHEKIMEALAVEERALLSDPTRQVTAEKRLQLATYAQALKGYLESVLDAESDPDDRFIRRLRSEYAVTRAEHDAVLSNLLSGAEGMVADLAEELRIIERSAHAIKMLELAPSPAHDFLAYLLRRRRTQATESLLRGLSFGVPGRDTGSLRVALSSPDGMSRESLRESLIEQLRAILPAVVSERLIEAYREMVTTETSMSTLTDMLQARLRSADAYVRAVALVALADRGAIADSILVELSTDEHDLVRETVTQLRARFAAAKARTKPELTTVDKMIALRSVRIFARLEPESLLELARASRDEEYSPDTIFCTQGQPGNDVFILLQGGVEVLTRLNDHDEVVGREKAGGIIGELGVLDTLPRTTTLRAGKAGARMLRLNGDDFRELLNSEASIGAQLVRTLAQRIRQESKSQRLHYE